MKKDLVKIRDTLIDIVFTVLFYGIFLWLSANLLFIAFNIELHLTILQAIAINFFAMVVLASIRGDKE